MTFLFYIDCDLVVSPVQLLSLTLDGLTGVAQDHMRSRFQTSANHMMLNVNLWSILVLGLGESLLSLLPTGDATVSH